ncbi:hypothetical protein ACFU6S_36955 [Streptomyces sp. NPDC057456]|uniref:hypothetical protein n=1 Tax=Streptomyces sp. NPDC057456 TaxID=3346139 RepID=UPI00368EFA14
MLDQRTALRTRRARAPCSRRGGGTRVVMVHCAPQPQDVIFRSELHDLVADKSDIER